MCLRSVISSYCSFTYDLIRCLAGTHSKPNIMLIYANLSEPAAKWNSGILEFIVLSREFTLSTLRMPRRRRSRKAIRLARVGAPTAKDEEKKQEPVQHLAEAAVNNFNDDPETSSIPKPLQHLAEAAVNNFNDDPNTSSIPIQEIWKYLPQGRDEGEATSDNSGYGHCMRHSFCSCKTDEDKDRVWLWIDYRSGSCSHCDSDERINENEGKESNVSIVREDLRQKVEHASMFASAAELAYCLRKDDVYQEVRATLKFPKISEFAVLNAVLADVS